MLVARYRGLLTAMAVFALLFALVNAISAGHLSYFDISFMASGSATLAIAAIGETIVILTGGFDLSAGAVISLVNVVLASSMDPASTHELIVVWTLAGIGVGMAAGCFNGIFIAFLGLQPIVVTLSTMFIAQGVTLLVMEKPGGFVASQLGQLLSRRCYSKCIADADPAARIRSIAMGLAEIDPVRRRALCHRKQ